MTLLPELSSCLSSTALADLGLQGDVQVGSVPHWSQEGLGGSGLYWTVGVPAQQRAIL